MDRLLAPDHPSRTGAVLRAQTQMCRMSAGKPLPRRRQDLVDSGDPQISQTLRLKHSKTHTLESKGKLNENRSVAKVFQRTFGTFGFAREAQRPSVMDD